jgi:hypothetical protein
MPGPVGGRYGALRSGYESTMRPESEDTLTAIARLKVPSTETELLRTAVGTFDVHSQLWPAHGAEPLVTEAVARRRMIDDLYLEEIMEQETGAPDPFSRICYLDFNPLSRRWEYVSLDTRIPAQLMYELSNDHTLGDRSTVVLHLPIFALPGWGSEVTGQSVRQRREITLAHPDHQEVRQYWSLPNASEYLAVEYLYSRQAG